MPVTLEYQFMKGQHTMHHKPGIFNAIWSDKAIDWEKARHGDSVIQSSCQRFKWDHWTDHDTRRPQDMGNEYPCHQHPHGRYQHR